MKKIAVALLIAPILLMGCNVAQKEEGGAMIQKEEPAAAAPVDEGSAPAAEASVSAEVEVDGSAPSN